MEIRIHGQGWSNCVESYEEDGEKWTASARVPIGAQGDFEEEILLKVGNLAPILRVLHDIKLPLIAHVLVHHNHGEIVSLTVCFSSLLDDEGKVFWIKESLKEVSCARGGSLYFFTHDSGFYPAREVAGLNLTEYYEIFFESLQQNAASRIEYYKKVKECFQMPLPNGETIEESFRN